jgi:cytochrome c553
MARFSIRNSLFLAGTAVTCMGLLSSGMAIAQTSVPAAACEACHGEGGNSRFDAIPRLNGQQNDYILARLKDFLDPTRETPHASQIMGPNATKLSSTNAASLAQYFSSRAPSISNAFGSYADIGKDVFLNGAGPDIPACWTCHGRDGQGLGTVPRISGQHANYLMAQLNAFSRSERSGTSMNHHAWDMTLEQMRNVTAYLGKD